MKKSIRVLGVLVVAVGALEYGGAAGHADTYDWPFSGAGTVFSPFPTHDPAGDTDKRCVNVGTDAALQRNDCDTRNGSIIFNPAPAPAPAPVGPKVPVPKPV